MQSACCLNCHPLPAVSAAALACSHSSIRRFRWGRNRALNMNAEQVQNAPPSVTGQEKRRRVGIADEEMQ